MSRLHINSSVIDKANYIIEMALFHSNRSMLVGNAYGLIDC